TLLGVPVVPIIASTGDGIEELRRVIGHALQHAAVPTPMWKVSGEIQTALDELIEVSGQTLSNPRWMAAQALESDFHASANIGEAYRDAFVQRATDWRQRIEKQQGQPIDVLIANSRFESIRSLT
ncbi:hypothetical protein Q4595_21395, partial [Wenyingzhuangia sp. 1_MG-2023]|nr:hypothetical protein [Wenyingzhuangia sp. 1_MG-2023]